MKVLTTDMVNTIIQRLVNEFDPVKIILFGSYAWGKPGNDSDIDLLVIVPDISTKLSSVQLSIRAHRCLRGLQIPKDILVRTCSEIDKYITVYASLEAEILEKGRVLYEQSKK